MTAAEFPPGCEGADPERVFFPGITVHLSTGCGGNLGAIMGKVREGLERADRDTVPDPTMIMDWLWGHIMGGGLSYDESLQLIMRTVRVT